MLFCVHGNYGFLTLCYFYFLCTVLTSVEKLLNNTELLPHMAIFVSIKSGNIRRNVTESKMNSRLEAGQNCGRLAIHSAASHNCCAA